MTRRRQDWSDIESVFATQGRRFDLGYVVDWLQGLIGAEDSRIARLEDLARETWERTDHID
jgi:hypothetical protein